MTLLSRVADSRDVKWQNVVIVSIVVGNQYRLSFVVSPAGMGTEYGERRGIEVCCVVMRWLLFFVL